MLNCNERIRIMHVLPSLEQGGAERLAVNLVSRVDRTEFEPLLVSFTDKRYADFDATLAAADVPVKRLHKRLGPDPLACIRFSRVARGFRPHVVHTHLHVLPYVLPALLMGQVPACLHTMHNIAGMEAQGLLRSFQRMAFARGVVPVAIAEAVAESIRETYGVPRPQVILNGIPIAAYSNTTQGRSAWRSENGFADDEMIFVCVARLSAQKQHALLLDAFAAACAPNAGARLVLVGDGILRPALEEQADILGIREQVSFLGTRSDVASILSSADVFVMASDYEGNPQSVMEAMAAGKPVIATAVGGIPELVTHEETGLLVNAGDLNAIAGALSMLLNNKALRTQMGESARTQALQRFDDQAMIQAYQRLYRDLLARQGRSSSDGR